MIPSYLEKKRKTRVGHKSLTPKEPIRIPSSNDFISYDNKATPTPIPQPSSPPPLQTKKPLSPINTSMFSVPGATWRRNWRPWIQKIREKISRRKFHVAFLTKNQQNHYPEQDIVHRPHIEPIHKQYEVVTPPQWT